MNLFTLRIYLRYESGEAYLTCLLETFALFISDTTDRLISWIARDPLRYHVDAIGNVPRSEKGG